MVCLYNFVNLKIIKVLRLICLIINYNQELREVRDSRKDIGRKCIRRREESGQMLDAHWTYELILRGRFSKGDTFQGCESSEWTVK